MQVYDERLLEVALVGQDPLARRGLASALGLEDVSVRTERRPGEDLGQERLDAVIWDDGVGLDELPRPDDRSPWVALTSDPARARRLLARGFRGALRRDAEPAQLAAALEAAVRGLIVIDPSFAQATLPPREAALDLTLHLSPRETEVLELLAEGLSNKEIAAELGLSPHTAKFHVTALLDKFGAETRTEAVVRAARAGLLAL